MDRHFHPYPWKTGSINTINLWSWVPKSWTRKGAQIDWDSWGKVNQPEEVSRIWHRRKCAFLWRVVFREGQAVERSQRWGTTTGHQKEPLRGYSAALRGCLPLQAESQFNAKTGTRQRIWRQNLKNMAQFLDVTRVCFALFVSKSTWPNKNNEVN